MRKLGTSHRSRIDNISSLNKASTRKAAAGEEAILLYELSKALVSIVDSPQAVNLVLDYLPQVVPCHVGGLFVRDDADVDRPWKFCIRFYRSGGENLLSQFTQKALTAVRAQPDDFTDVNKVATVIQGVRQPSESAAKEEAELKSFLCLPLVTDGQTIGMLGVGSASDDVFNDDQERFLTAVACQAAVSIKNGQLFALINSKRQKLEKVINQMSEGLIMLDQNRRVTIFNTALERMTGLRATEVIGKPLEELKPLLVFLNQVERPVGLLPFDKPRSRVLKLSAAEVANGTDQHSEEIQVIQDITEERELTRMKSEFVANISHELRTPLHSISGFTKLMLEDKVPDPETQREFLTIIDHQSEHLSELVNSIIDVSSIEAGQFKIQKRRLAMAEIIHNVIAGFYSLANEKGIVIKMDMQTPLPDVDGDDGRLRQVLNNLVGNAMKFSDNSSIIIVKAQVENGELLVQIIDHGIGIPAESMPHLFERFYRARDPMARGGTGLGLYISKQIVEKHGGHIWVESKVGKGSTFSFTISLYVGSGGSSSG